MKYNGYFGPFYRTSQVIATLKKEFADLPPEEYADVNGKVFSFDQVLNKTYWPELMALQAEVAESSIWLADINMTVSYDDVCLNPLADENDPTQGGCAIFSAFEYWQNDIERVDRIHKYYPDRQNPTKYVNTTYKDHFLYCSKTPSSLTDKFTSSQGSKSLARII